MSIRGGKGGGDVAPYMRNSRIDARAWDKIGGVVTNFLSNNTYPLAISFQSIPPYPFIQESPVFHA